MTYELENNQEARFLSMSLFILSFVFYFDLLNSLGSIWIPEKPELFLENLLFSFAFFPILPALILICNIYISLSCVLPYLTCILVLFLQVKDRDQILYLFVSPIASSTAL